MTRKTLETCRGVTIQSTYLCFAYLFGVRQVVAWKGGRLCRPVAQRPRERKRPRPGTGIPVFRVREKCPYALSAIFGAICDYAITAIFLRFLRHLSFSEDDCSNIRSRSHKCKYSSWIGITTAVDHFGQRLCALLPTVGCTGHDVDTLRNWLHVLCRTPPTADERSSQTNKDKRP